MKKIELQPGDRFGKLMIIEHVGGRQNEYNCLCDCGNQYTARARNLTRKSVVSCGCQKRRPIKPGTIFGCLKVLKDLGWDKIRKKSRCLCLCECGKTVKVSNDKLKGKKTVSCGCWSVKISRELGKSKKGNIYKPLKPGIKFGRLTVCGLAEKGHPFYNLKCDCGNTKTANAKHLRFGHLRSCGCLYIEHARKIGKDKRIRPETMSAKEFASNREKKQRESLSDRYIKNMIAQKRYLTTKDIPQELIELKRLQLSNNRKLKGIVNG